MKNYLIFSMLYLFNGCGTSQSKPLTDIEIQALVRETINNISSRVRKQSSYICDNLNDKNITVTIQINIDRKGRLKTSEIVDSSGNNNCDKLINKAINDTAPFYEVDGLDENIYEKFREIRFVFSGEHLSR